MLDLESLRFIWWFLLGFLFIGFAVTDGFDFGVAMLLPFIARNEADRHVVLNTVKPFWEGNQVWIILGAGAVFAAWPYVYAVAFSGPYLAVLLLLLTMGISRPVSFKYRNKMPGSHWRRFWDWIAFIGGFFPALIFGILCGNILQGLPFYFDDTLRIFYSGTLLQLFNPFALWCGFTSVFMLIMHGGLYLAVKAEDPIRQRSITAANVAALLLVVFFAAAGWWVAKKLPGFQVLSLVDHVGYSNPMHKQVGIAVGAWLQNYYHYPLTMIFPALGFLGALLVLMTSRWGNSRFAFFSSSISIMGVIATFGVSMFPFLLPSNTNTTASLLVWDASSSQLTLSIMLAMVIIFMPIILIYTAWVYRVLGGKVTPTMIEYNEKKHIGY